MRKLNYNFLDCARKMPPLHHRKQEQFNIKDSEVANWLISQPEIIQKVFDMAANNGIIKFDKETGTWRGSDL